MGGADWEFSRSKQNDTDSLSTLERAIEYGVNWIDTAPIYGLGHAEEIVGKSLQYILTARRPLILTKCSLV